MTLIGASDRNDLCMIFDLPGRYDLQVDDNAATMCRSLVDVNLMIIDIWGILLLWME